MSAMFRLASADHQKLVDELVEAQCMMQKAECDGSIKGDPALSTLYGRAAAAIADLSERVHGAEACKLRETAAMRREQFRVVKD